MGRARSPPESGQRLGASSTDPPVLLALSEPGRIGLRLVARFGNEPYYVHVSATQNAASLLRDLRRQQGRSLRSAAADIGIAPSQLSRLERGQRGLALEVSERLSEYYGVSSEIIALAQGEIPQDVVSIFQEHPEELARLRVRFGVEAP